MYSGLRLLAIGVVIGVAFSLGLARVIADLVFGVSAWDFQSFAGVTLLMTGIALAASYFRRGAPYGSIRQLHGIADAANFDCGWRLRNV
jgi:hypothetical protein